jgi:alpha-L-rhamnosidase
MDEERRRCRRRGAARAVLAGLAAGALFQTACDGSRLRVARLFCDGRENPWAIEGTSPRLSWTLFSNVRGERQTAYRVLVASTAEALARDVGDLWDSGRVESDRSVLIPYAGKPQASRRRACWKVRVWDKAGRPSDWSVPAAWTNGDADGDEWLPTWIAAADEDGPLPLFRRAFRVGRRPSRALLDVCGLGFFELRLNGEKVGDHEFDPGWTDYRKRCLYVRFDVTDRILRGRNAMGVLLGNGLYNVRGGRYVKFTGSFGPPKLALRLRLEYPDGTVEDVVSGADWKTSPGPIVFSCIYGGEDYDARLEIPGWDRPGFDDSAWRPVAVVPGPGGRLVPQTAPPVKVMRRFPAVASAEPKPGVVVYDLGQNMSGWPGLSVRGPSGATVKLVPGELLGPDGLVSQRSSGTPVSFSYTLRGGGEAETWRPRFSYYGFRYVQVEGVVTAGAGADGASRPVVLGLEGQFVHSSARVVGRFASSDPLVNRIHNLILRAVESNLQSVVTDCPHREKLGWLEVSHLLGPAIFFNYDVAALYRKICADTADSQLANGLVPDIAPEFTVFEAGFRDSPEWGSAAVINPGLLDLYAGDSGLLAENYETMKRYAEYLGSRADGFIVSHGLGDWCDVGPGSPGESQLTSKGLTATAIYYQDLRVLEKAAGLMGRIEEAGRWAALAEEVRQAFNARFFRRDDRLYDRGSQTAQAMPLALEMVDEADRPVVLDGLVATIRAGGNRVTAGDIGFVYVVRALHEGGRGDVLWDMVTQPDGPGYADQLRKGATTLAEAWDANPALSQNHCMLGHAEEWFYRGLAGLSPDPAAPGFKRFFIRPDVVGTLRWVEAEHDSPYGRIVSAWEKKGGRLFLRVVVPPNTTAVISIPADRAGSVLEGGRPAADSPGVRYLRSAGGRSEYEIGSGKYRFSCPFSD